MTKQLLLSVCLMQSVLCFACHGGDTAPEASASNALPQHTAEGPQTYKAVRKPRQYVTAFNETMQKAVSYRKQELKCNRLAGHCFNHLQEDLEQHFGAAFPTKPSLQAMQKFIDHDKVLAVGSGNGFIEGMLKARGVNILATDIKQPKTPYIE